MSPGVCFIAGTLVSSEDGLVPIEEIKPGQMVWAQNPETGERALKQVVRIFRNKSNELVHVYINDETITCTPEHPFYVNGVGWVAAKNLKPNCKLVLQNGKVAVVKDIRREKLSDTIEVFNFEVEDFYTYFVGENCVLVHNSCAHNSKWNGERRKYWRKQAHLYRNNVHGQESQSGTYLVTKENIRRMLRGSAPIGTDEISVALHHRQGISSHRSNFKALHPWVK